MGDSENPLNYCPCGEPIKKEIVADEWSGRFQCSTIEGDVTAYFFFDATFVCERGKLAVFGARRAGTKLITGRVHEARKRAQLLRMRLRNAAFVEGPAPKRTYLKPERPAATLEELREAAGL